MASLEKLIKTIEQLRIIESSNTDAGNAKKKEVRQLLSNLVELNCNAAVQSHKDFVSYISPSIDALIRLYDSKDSDVRLASDEGLYKVIKALLPLHSNRVLVEFCKQIKKSSSPRVLKLAMNRFAELCHHARPQKRRAYLANLLNAISALAVRPEEMLHETLAHFAQKVFSVMGLFAFENETKTLLKTFLTNLASPSSIIRRSAAIAVTAIVSNNRKSEMLLALVVEYLTDLLLLPAEENQTAETPLIIGALLCLKMLLPLFPPTITNPVEDQLNRSIGSIRSDKAASNLHLVTMERIIQILELCVYYSMYPTDHNVVNAALELFQQLLKMRALLVAIPALSCPTGLQGTRISSRGLLKTNSQWNLTPLPMAEESHLLEAEVSVNAFGRTGGVETVDGEADVSEVVDFIGSTLEQGNDTKHFADLENEGLEIAEEAKDSSAEDGFEQELPAAGQSSAPSQVIDIGTLYDSKGYSPLLYCARHLAHHFLLTDQKGQLKSDRLVRVSVKSLALNCLIHVGVLDPSTWNTPLTESNSAGGIVILDVLRYSTHDDPQLRGQAALLACTVLSSVFGGLVVPGYETKALLAIVNEALKDKETSACRLALQGLQPLLPMALERNFCSEMVPLLDSLLTLSANPYWLVKVDLLEVFSSLPWVALEFGVNCDTQVCLLPVSFQRTFLDMVILRLIGDEDHRVRNAVASCLVALVRMWTTSTCSPDLVRLKQLSSALKRDDSGDNGVPKFAGVSLFSINGLAEAYRDVPTNDDVGANLTFFVEEILQLLVTSNSKFTKMGCIQSLSALSVAYHPTAYQESFGCNATGNCGLLKLVVALMTNSALMLDLATHQSLLALAAQVFSGCVKSSLNAAASESDQKDWRFLNGPTVGMATSLLVHVSKTLNAFCCALEDVNPLSSSAKAPLVTLPGPSALSPIRRKVSKAVEGSVLEREEKPEDFGRKWNKPTQLLNTNNLGYFLAQPLYVKLYDLLKGTYSTCKLNFDTATTERLSSFIQSVLNMLSVLLEVALFPDMGKHSEEILSYLRYITAVEPVHSLYNVQQMLKALFGANLAAVWRDEATRLRRSSLLNAKQSEMIKKVDDDTFFANCGIHGVEPEVIAGTSPSHRTAKTSPSHREKPNVIVKFRTNVGKLGPDKVALSSYIRLFEPMVIKALKLYTVTSSPQVQKQVLDLLCELIHLCVNYCLLDADQVFLNFVIQQFEFLEEGFIPQVEILLPSMFRFLSLLSYDRYHSKTIISVPRIMQLSGGLMATGKDTQQYVLPTLRPMVEDLFLSKERMSDNFKELETQREVLISILLRLIQYHEVYPLLSVILVQVQSESTVKWKALSKQVCDVLIPQLHRHSLDLDTTESLRILHKLFSHLDPPVVHESLLGLLQTFSSAQSEDPSYSSNPDYHRTLACRLAVIEALVLVFDESFLLDCLSEFHLGYLVSQHSDPLSVSPEENVTSDRILSSLLLGTLRSALSFWKSKLDLNNSGPLSSSWKMDEGSFAARLVMDYTALVRRLQCSSDFPVLQAAINAELESEDLQKALLLMSSDMIPSNPVVFVRICDLFAKKMPSVSLPQFNGLNGNIAHSGTFLVQCCYQLTSDVGNLTDFVTRESDQILKHSDALPVQRSVGKLMETEHGFDILMNCLCEKRGEPLVISAMSLLRILEISFKGEALTIRNEALLLKALSSLQNIPHGVVHRKLCGLLMKWWKSVPSREVRHLLLNVIQSSANRSFYSELMLIPREADPATSEAMRIQVDKAFVLDYALKRHQDPSVWKRILPHLTPEDLPKLLDEPDCIMSVLTDGRTLNPGLFSTAKNLFLREASCEDPERDQIISGARVLDRFLDSIPRGEVDSFLSPSEIGRIAKLCLSFLAAMGPLYPATVLLHSTSKAVAKLGENVIVEWSRVDNFPSVKKAVSSLGDFLVTLRNGTACGVLLEQAELTGFDRLGEAELALIEPARQLGRLITFMERESKSIEEILCSDIKRVLAALCRMPICYSYVCIPPSVWARGWTPIVKLDTEQLKLNLPVIPSHFLHDEVVLKEFVYRIKEIGWTCRQKFEEIWMSFLGILNLATDDEVRLEEQASVVQATCEAVRGLTMVLQKNLPFTAEDSLHKKSAKFAEFMKTERGEKLQQLYSLLDSDCDKGTGAYSPICRFNRLSFSHISSNMDPGSPSKSKSASPEDVSQVDIQSCVHFLVDLYAQWLQNSEVSYPLLVEVFRSLSQISNFFTDRQHFEWMLDSAISIQKAVQPEDPPCLESALTICMLKSAAFAPVTNADTWESVKRSCDASLSSQHISTRASGLDGIMYLLQRLTWDPDPSRATALVHLAMEYVAKYLGSENVGPDWHQSWLWSLAFYCGEHFGELPFRSHSVIDFVAQCALNGLLETKKQSVRIQHQILQGLEDLCIIDKLPPNWRRLAKKEILNVVRNVERDAVLRPALHALLSLVYSDFVNQLYKPGADPETMLVAMEWVGALFQRMKRGTDEEADLLGRVMPILTCDIFPPADILNRILSEFMSSRTPVAYSLTPTIFKVFGTARAQGQQSLVLEWILLSLGNFTRARSGSEAVAVWNILCFFTAASQNPWLQSAFPLVSRPVDQNDSAEMEVFVASALDFRSQLDDKQRLTLASIFSTAREEGPFYAAVHDALSKAPL